ncbi:uncharacterized protein LOC128990667 [Macrosteles quadrilineatus]|uniref:uncharacterized protein LOC128990667 n=1 Tax=Macrosteles quadrilineatus TaxID=74068 RepID=UPI0023E2D58D|nr:uncharacterized protein LOC128990667 [Macrosteles quadrilineatus]
MGTKMVAFSNVLLILQLVATAYSNPHESVISFDNNSEGDSSRQYMLIQTNASPTGYHGAMQSRSVDPNDIEEMQFPRPPTKESMETFDDNSTRQPKYSESNSMSGSGNVDTNEIVKMPDSYQSQTNDETTNEQATGTKRFNFPQLDNAVENAVNHLPTSQESSLSPLIRKLSERIKEEANDNTRDPEELEKRQILQKLILLKLAKKAHTQKLKTALGMYGKPQAEEPVAQERKEEENTIQREVTNDMEPCDCDGGCDEMRSEQQTPEIKTEPESQQVRNDMACQEEEPTNQVQNEQQNTLQSSRIGNLRDESEQTENVHPKLHARITITIKRSKPDEGNVGEDIPSPSAASAVPMQSFQFRQPPPLVEIFSKMIKNSVIINSPKTVGQNEYVPSQNENVQSASEESGGGCMDANDSSESTAETHVPSVIRIIPNGDENEKKQPYFSLSSGQGMENEAPSIMVHPEGLPKELILFKLLNSIIKQKALANALKERQMLPSYHPSDDSSSAPRMVILRVRHEPSAQGISSEIPPLHFPDENSGFKIKHFDDLSEASDSDEPRHMDFPGSESKHIPLPLHFQKDSQPNDSPQELPWFIKNIIMNLNGQRGGLQPIPTTPTQLSSDAAQKAPVFLRSILAPYAI